MIYLHSDCRGPIRSPLTNHSAGGRAEASYPHRCPLAYAIGLLERPRAVTNAIMLDEEHLHTQIIPPSVFKHQPSGTFCVTRHNLGVLAVVENVATPLKVHPLATRDAHRIHGELGLAYL